MEQAEDIHHTIEIKEIYHQQKRNGPVKDIGRDRGAGRFVTMLSAADIFIPQPYAASPRIPDRHAVAFAAEKDSRKK